MTELFQLEAWERDVARDYVRLRGMTRRDQLRNLRFVVRTRRDYARANQHPFGRLGPDRRDGDLGRYISETFYGFTVGKFAYRYEQFWYPGVNLESIGAFTSLAANITLTGMNHPLEHVTTSPIVYLAARGFVDTDRPDRMAPERNQRVRIGNDVWIGQNVTILPGVLVADGAVVGAGSVVTSDVAPYTIVAGNPARPIRRRFDDETVEALLRTRWWEWDDEMIKFRIDLLADPRRFLEAFR